MRLRGTHSISCMQLWLKNFDLPRRVSALVDVSPVHHRVKELPKLGKPGEIEVLSMFASACMQKTKEHMMKKRDQFLRDLVDAVKALTKNKRSYGVKGPDEPVEWVGQPKTLWPKADIMIKLPHHQIMV
jgi:hypothetical protein